MFPVGIGLRDPRSQKRDLGHPSVLPFDVAEGTSFVISLPTRLSESAARDDKGKGDDAVDSGCWTDAAFHHLGLAAPMTTTVEMTILLRPRRRISPGNMGFYPQ